MSEIPARSSVFDSINDREDDNQMGVGMESQYVD